MNKFLGIVNKILCVINGIAALLCVVCSLVCWIEGDIYALMVLLWFPVALMLGAAAYLGYRYSKTKQIVSLAIGLLGLFFSITCIVSASGLILDFLKDGTLYV